MSKTAASPSDGQPDPRLVVLTCQELAEFLKLPSVETVYQWRRKHTGPQGFRAGRHVRFTLAAVLAWMDSQARQDAA
ncbi:helix-turn-helix transcriptional regulator [Kitasatospora sp. NPDC089913]|uniref:helix-turn-helix transcriptional regulator n=1 Tax=Kitasatospora sp. NPDC089913 TaxID=3364080 RepID=UPI0038176AE2